MKDSKLYVDKIKKLQRELKSSYGKLEPVTYEDPVDALVYGMLSEPITERKAHAASKRVNEYFLDLNDLRVSRPEEIAETIGQDDEAVREMAAALSQSLMSVFNRYHEVTLEELAKLGKRPAKQALDDIDGLTRFAAGYVMLTSLQGHAIPLTERMVAFLKDGEYVHPNATPEAMEGFLTKQISAKDNYEFYMALRLESESTQRSRKVKTAKKSTKKVAKKKATTKKTTKKVAKKTTSKKVTKKTTQKTVKKKTKAK